MKPQNQIPGTAEFQDHIKSDEASIHQYGYIKKDDPEIHSLLNFNKGNRKLSKKNLTASADTGLYENVNDIQMAYHFHGVPKSVITKEIGVGPAGTYLDNDEQKGWTGAAQIVEIAHIGTCNYQENNARLNHSSVFIAQEKVTYDINRKITLKEIEGEVGKGFMYTVQWFDTDFYRTLKCAQADFSSNTMPAVINLAIAIDNNSR